MFPATPGQGGLLALELRGGSPSCAISDLRGGTQAAWWKKPPESDTKRTRGRLGKGKEVAWDKKPRWRGVVEDRNCD